ncbi:hypothetical protein JW948_13425 [bacterium]|nr:hypothetical protein [bacterium]
MKPVEGVLMRRLIRSILCASVLIGGLNATAGPMTLAVLDFENRTFLQAEKYAPLSQGLAEMMITELSRIQSVHMVERRRLKELLDELKLQQSGMTSGDGAMQVGRMSGAGHLVFGSFMVVSDNKIRIDLRIVEVETGKNLKAAEVTGKTRDILSLIKKLSGKIVNDLSLILTKEEAGQLERSGTLEINAVMSFSRGLVLEDQNDINGAYAEYKKALEIEPEFEQAKQAIARLVRMKKEQ